VGDEFTRFFDDHYEPIVRSLTLVFGDRPRAEDAAQVGFERAYRKWRTVGSLDRPATWVYVVALRDARRQLQREDRRPRPDLELEPVGFDDASATGMDLRASLAALPLRQRTAVVLRYLGGLSGAEVATAMGCTEGTVKATLHHALARLRVDLTDQESLRDDDGVASDAT